MITYLVNFVLCSGLLLLIYRAFLGNENLYRFNRFYLLFSLVFSLAVPFVTIEIPGVKLPVFNQQVIDQRVSRLFNKPARQEAMAQTTQPQIIKQTAPVVAAGPVRQAMEDQALPAEQIQVQQIASPAVVDVVRASAQPQVSPTPKANYFADLFFALYIMGALVMLFRFMRNTYHIRQTVSQNAVIDYDDTRLVLLDEEVTPHSFWKYVFISKKEYQNGHIAPEIICHEQTHVRQLHSLDVIIIELLQAVCWFNPFIPFYRRAIQLNHEFLADEAVIKNYDDTPSYQILLLAKASQGGSLYLTSQFNYLTTKKRLIMMTKSTSAKIALAKKVAIIPVLAGVIVLFSHWVAAKNALSNKNGVFHDVTLSEWNEMMHPDANHTPGYVGEYDAQDFIRKFNIKYNKQYRLPTKEEWEGAVSEGIKSKYLLLIESNGKKMFKANSTPQVYDAANRIFYSVSNDDDKLYLTARLADLYSTEKVINDGITFTVEVPAETANNKPGKIKNASLTFPAADPKMNHHQEAENCIKFLLDAKKLIKDKTKIDSIHALTNILMSGGGYIVKSDNLKAMHFFQGQVYEVSRSGFQYIDEDDKDIKVAHHYNDQMQYVLKLGISLKYLGAAINSGKKFRYNVELNGVPQFDPKKIPTATSGVGDPNPFLMIPADAKKADVDFVHHTTALSGEYALVIGDNNSSTEKYGVILDRSRQTGPHAGTPELNVVDENKNTINSDSITKKHNTDFVRFPINYASTKNGISEEALKEYDAIANKYIDATKLDHGIIRTPTPSPEDRKKLEQLFGQMSRAQQNQQKLAFTSFKKYPVIKPTQAQFDEWQAKKYRLYIDGKRVSEAELAHHQPDEFYHYSVDKEHYHTSAGFTYGVALMTEARFNEFNKEMEEPRIIYNYGSQGGNAATGGKKINAELLSADSIAKILAKFPIPKSMRIKYAEKDAPDEVLRAYQDILKKYDLYASSGAGKLTAVSSADSLKMHELFTKMSMRQQDRQYVRFEKALKPFGKNSVAKDQLQLWKNNSDYGVWVNNKRVKNATLANYQPVDFDHFFVSNLTPIAIKNDGFKYQVELMTKASYADYYKKTMADQSDKITHLHIMRRQIGITRDKTYISNDNGPIVELMAANTDQSQRVNNENNQAISMKYGSDGQAIRFAEKDAPQRIISEYQAILKKSNLPYKKSDQINLTPALSAADREKLKALYVQMSRKQQMLQYVRVVPKFGVPGSPNNDKSPTVQQLATWRNAGDYLVVVNNSGIKNDELAKYKPSDFDQMEVVTAVYPKKSNSKRPGSMVLLWTKKYHADYLRHMRASTEYSMTQWGKGHELIVMNNW